MNRIFVNLGRRQSCQPYKHGDVVVLPNYTLESVSPLVLYNTHELDY